MANKALSKLGWRKFSGSHSRVAALLVFAMLLTPAAVLLASRNGEKLVEAGVVEKANIRVEWTHVKQGISHQVFDIKIQNLENSQRTVDVLGRISNANFPISKLKNIEFYIWAGQNREIGVGEYDNVDENALVENVKSFELISQPENEVDVGDLDSSFFVVTTLENDDNFTAGFDSYDNLGDGTYRIYYDVWIIIATHPENITVAGWRRITPQAVKQYADRHDTEIGELVLSPANSPVIRDNFGIAIRGKGTLGFRVEFDAPVVQREGGWGSAGLLRLSIDNELYGSEYVGESGSSWWDENWPYRAPITLGPHPKNYQIKLELDNYENLGGHLAIDNWDDIRILENETTGELNYWIENYIIYDNGADNSEIFIRRLENEASDSTVYLYYGNASAGSVSSYDSTMAKDFGDSGLVLLHHMDDGSGSSVADSSGNANTGTLQGDTAWVGSDGGQWDNRNVSFSTGDHLDFLGTDDYENVPSSASLDITGDITVEMWAKFDTVQTTILVAKREGESGFVLTIITDKPAFRISTTNYGAYTAQSPNAVTTGEWYHIVGTYDDDNNQVSIYVDSVLENYNINTDGLGQALVTLHIGIEPNLSQELNGQLDDLRIYNRCLTDAEVLAHYERRKFYTPEPTITIGAEETPAVAPVLPTQPTLIAPENDSTVYDNTPTFDWVAGENADNHTLRVDNNSDFSSPEVEENGLLVDTFTIADENALADGTYWWSVIAVNENGENASDNYMFTLITSGPFVFGWEENGENSQNVSYGTGYIPVSVHSVSGQEGENDNTKAIDNDLTTFWHHEASEPWIIFDLGESRTVTQFLIYLNTKVGTWGVDGMLVYVSENTVDWGDNVWSGELKGTPKGWKGTGEFSKLGQYIKLVSQSQEDTEKMIEIQFYIEWPPSRRILGSIFRLKHLSGTINNITAYFSTGNYFPENMKAAVYYDNGTLIGETEQMIFQDDVNSAWWTFSFPEDNKPELTYAYDDGQYVLVLWGNGDIYFNYDNVPGSTNQGHYAIENYADNFPDTVTFIHDDAKKFSIYASVSYTGGWPADIQYNVTPTMGQILTDNTPLLKVDRDYAETDNINMFRFLVDNDSNFSSPWIDENVEPEYDYPDGPYRASWTVPDENALPPGDWYWKPIPKNPIYEKTNAPTHHFKIAGDAYVTTENAISITSTQATLNASIFYIGVDNADVHFQYKWKPENWFLENYAMPTDPATSGDWANRSPVNYVAASDSEGYGFANYVCDGTGDQVEINSAIDNVTAGGGLVYLYDGTYSIQGSILLQDNVSLVGENRDNTIITTGGVLIYMIRVYGDNTLIENLSVIGAEGWWKGSSETNGISAIVTATDSVVIRNVYLQYFSYSAFNLEKPASTNWWIIDSEIRDTGGPAIYTEDIRGFYFDNNTIIRGSHGSGYISGEAAIDIRASRNGIIANNHLVDSGQQGIMIRNWREYDASENILIESNLIENSGYLVNDQAGIDLRGTSGFRITNDITIRRNRFFDNKENYTGYGVYFNNAYVENTVIDNNDFFYVENAWVELGSGHVIENNMGATYENTILETTSENDYSKVLTDLTSNRTYGFRGRIWFDGSSDTGVFKYFSTTPFSIENLYITDMDNVAADNLTPQTQYKFNIEIADSQTLADIENVTMVVYLDNENLADNEVNHYTFRWTRDGGFDETGRLQWEHTEGEISQGYPVGDPDNDGNNELMFENGSGLEIWEWNGSTYVYEHGITLTNLSGYVSGNVDNDPEEELILVNDNVYVFEWNGSTFFQAFTYNPGGNIYDVNIGEADNNETPWPEIILSIDPDTVADNNIEVLTYDSASDNYVIKGYYYVGVGITAMAEAGDVDNDGENEIVFAYGTAFYVIQWNGSAYENIFDAVPLANRLVYGVAIGDVDDNGVDDILLGGGTFAGSTLIWLYGWNGSTFVKNDTVLFSGEGSVLEAVDMGQFGGDDELKVVAVTDNAVHIMRWSGTDLEEESYSPFALPSVSGWKVMAQFGDATNDGRNELIISKLNSPAILWVYQQGYDHLHIDNCVTGDDSLTTDNIVFTIEFGEDATVTADDNWDVWVQVYDSAGNEDNRFFLNQFDIVSAAPPPQEYERPVEQGFSLTESAPRGAEFGRMIEQGFSFGAVVTIIMEIGKLLSQAFGITASVGVTLAWGKSISQGFSLTGSVEVNREFDESVVQDFSLTGAVSANVERWGAIDQTFSFDDSVSAVAEYGRSVEQGFFVSATVEAVVDEFVQEYERSIEQSFSFTGSVEANRELDRNITQDFSLAESIMDGREIAINLSDALSLSATVTAPASFVRELGGSWSFTATVETQYRYVRAIAQEFSVSATVGIEIERLAREYERSIEQGFSIVGTIIAHEYGDIYVTSPWCDGRVNPIDVVANPTFSAIYTVTDNNIPNPAQFIQIQVGTSWNDNDFWDNIAIVTVENGQRSLNVSYDGMPLTLNSSYWWRCRFGDSNDNLTEWTSPQTFGYQEAPFDLVAAAMFIFPIVLMIIAFAFDNVVFASFAGIVFIISGLFFVDVIWLAMIFVGVGVYLLITAFLSEED